MAKAFRELPLPDIEKLLASPFHEHRLIALLVMVDQHARSEAAQKKTLHRFYLDHLQGVNNWDLVDTSASEMVGKHAAANPKLLLKLAKSKCVWHRRIAIVSTFAELREGRTAMTLTIAEQLLGDDHDLIHKAVGWLLREVGKVSPDALTDFLRAHYAELPRTTLRYAIERLDGLERKAWLKGPAIEANARSRRESSRWSSVGEGGD